MRNWILSESLFRFLHGNAVSLDMSNVTLIPLESRNPHGAWYLQITLQLLPRQWRVYKVQSLMYDAAGRVVEVEQVAINMDKCQGGSTSQLDHIWLPGSGGSSVWLNLALIGVNAKVGNRQRQGE